MIYISKLVLFILSKVLETLYKLVLLLGSLFLFKHWKHLINQVRFRYVCTFAPGGSVLQVKRPNTKTHLAKILQILFPLLPLGWSLFSVGRPVEKSHLGENFPGAIFLYNFLGKNSFIEKLRKTLFLEKNFVKTPLIRLCICHSKPLKILHLVFIPLIFFSSFFRLLFLGCQKSQKYFHSLFQGCRFCRNLFSMLFFMVDEISASSFLGTPKTPDTSFFVSLCYFNTSPIFQYF